MGLAAIDPHGHKVSTELYKIPKFGIVSKMHHLKNVKIYKEMYGHPDTVRTRSPSGHTFLCKF